MKQKYATQEDVDRIINHAKNLMRLHNLGFYETTLLVYGREAIPVGLVFE